MPLLGRDVDSGHTFMGSVVSDFARTGIGQLLPTGSVIGFSANLATGGLASKHTPSFAWRTARNSGPYEPEKALAVAQRAMARRKITMGPEEERLFLGLPSQTADLEKP